MKVRPMLRALFCVGLAALVLAPLASAHVTINPREWEAGGFARFALRVPNETPDADTTKIVVKFPENVTSASFQPVPGWTRTVQTVELETPVTDEDGNEITERIDTVTWEGGVIKPGEFQEFGVSFQVPDEAGATIVFPSVQTYSDGEVVRWIGPEDSDAPAPAVAILAPGEEEPVATEPAETTPSETTLTFTTDSGTEASAAGDDEDEDDDDGKTNLALGLGIAGLLAGLAALGLVLTRDRKRPQA
jgi:uncharacterized protein YcnI